MISPEYAAGFFDGEGCVSYLCMHRSESRIPEHKRKHRSRGTDYYEWHIRLTLSNTNLDVLLAFQDAWSGSITAHTANGRNCKIIHQWSVGGHKGERFALAIIPYSIVKRKQIELFLAFRATVGLGGQRGINKDSETFNKRNEIGMQIIALNRKGVHPVKETSLIREHHLRPIDALLVKPICTVDGCDRSSKSLDLCNRHYLQHYRKQRVLAGKSPR